MPLLEASVATEEWAGHGQVFLALQISRAALFCVLNFLQSVNEKLWAANELPGAVVQAGQNESTDESLSRLSSE